MSARERMLERRRRTVAWIATFVFVAGTWTAAIVTAPGFWAAR